MSKSEQDKSLFLKHVKHAFITDPSYITLVLIYFFGIIFNATPSLREFAKTTTPLVLTLVFGILVFEVIKSRNYKLLIAILAIAIFTYSIEVIGVNTGFPFGDYSYGPTLGPKSSGTPFLIAANWVIVVLGFVSLALRLSHGKIRTSLMASALATIFDVLLEPVAVKLDYWNWSDGIIPLQNYISWFAITFVLSMIILTFADFKRQRKFEFVAFLQTLFFAVLVIALN